MKVADILTEDTARVHKSFDDWATDVKKQGAKKHIKTGDKRRIYAVDHEDKPVKHAIGHWDERDQEGHVYTFRKRLAKADVPRSIIDEAATASIAKDDDSFKVFNNKAILYARFPFDPNDKQSIETAHDKAEQALAKIAGQKLPLKREGEVEYVENDGPLTHEEKLFTHTMKRARELLHQLREIPPKELAADPTPYHNTLTSYQRQLRNLIASGNVRHDVVLSLDPQKKLQGLYIKR